MVAKCSALISRGKVTFSATFLLGQRSYLSPTATETSKSGDGRRSPVCLSFRGSYLENGGEREKERH